MSDIVERLQAAASAAIAKERPALESETDGYIAGVTLELVLTWPRTWRGLRLLLAQCYRVWVPGRTEPASSKQYRAI